VWNSSDQHATTQGAEIDGLLNVTVPRVFDHHPPSGGRMESNGTERRTSALLALSKRKDRAVKRLKFVCTAGRNGVQCESKSDSHRLLDSQMVH
jgi:hypothetical protein